MNNSWKEKRIPQRSDNAKSEDEHLPSAFLVVSSMLMSVIVIAASQIFQVVVTLRQVHHG